MHIESNVTMRRIVRLRVYPHLLDHWSRGGQRLTSVAWSFDSSQEMHARARIATPRMRARIALQRKVKSDTVLDVYVVCAGCTHV